jgi:hypothetical protein
VQHPACNRGQVARVVVANGGLVDEGVVGVLVVAMIRGTFL